MTTKEELAETVALLLVDEPVRKEKVSITRRLLETQTHVLDYVIEALEEKLKEKDGGSDGTRTRDLRRDRPTTL